MSFTIKVKEELLGLGRQDKTELSAIIKMSGSLGISSQGLTLSVTTENAKIARHIYELLAAFYKVKSQSCCVCCRKRRLQNMSCKKDNFIRL